MRLGIEVTTCTRSRTGVGYYTEHLVDALLETRGAGDDLVLMSNRPPAPELATRWSPHLHVRGPGVRAAWMQSEVPRLLTETGVDVAVFPNYAAPLASPCPTVVVVHDLAVLRTPQNFTLQKRLLMRPMLQQSVAAASVIATVSEASQRDIMALLGVSRERIALLPCAAHPSCSPAPHNVVAEVRMRHGLFRPYVLTVGTLEPRKNLLTLLRAFDRLDVDGHEYDLVVVGGRGWRDRKLVRALEARTARQHVRWLGYVPESDLVALYTGAELFVLASTLEGFGLPILEAMACGTRVIASDVAALREVGGDVPRFVPPTDDAAFARAIAQALRDHHGVAAARAAGLARARQFSWARTAEALWARARLTGPSRVRASASAGRMSSSDVPPARSGLGRDGEETPLPVNGRGPTASAPLPFPLHPPPPGLTTREWALLATVVYADLFNSPLPLVGALTASVGLAFDEAEVRRLAKGPGLSPLLTLHPSGFLVMAGREHLVDPMPEREALTRQLLDRNRARLSTLAALPFVRALVISGGVAHRNPGTRPDVDLFVVAARGRAYTAYTMLFLATKLTGTRHLICPNYLVDENELAIAYHRDLFTAHQLVSARPFSGQPAYEALCRTNEAWVRSFFPAFAPQAASNARLPTASQLASELALWPAAPVLEGLFRWAWRFRLRRRAATAIRPDLVLGNGILKLHLSDYRRTVLERFAARLDSLRAQLGSDSQPARAGLEPVGT
jgi:glycosyltransferase involved in cell wall biosynthesis